MRSSRSSSSRCWHERELLAAADDAAQNAYAPYSSFFVGAVARARDGRLFTGVNVENAAYPLGICAERCCLGRCGDGRAEAGRPGGDRDHGVAVRRLPPVAGRVAARARHVPARERRGRHRDAGRPAARLVRPVKSGIVAVAGPAERRQVDARERALRRQGRDRLGQAADDAAADLRSGERRGLAARAGRPPRLPAPARPADRAHAAHRRRVLRGRRRGAARARRARADRRRRPVHRQARLRPRRAGRDRAEQGRPPQAGSHRAAAARTPRGSATSTRSTR